MLKKIPTAISPELMKGLMEMGHGGEIMISDGNCGAEKFGTARPIVVRMDGMRVPEILEAVLQFMPLDDYVSKPVTLCRNDPWVEEPKIWKEYERIIRESEEADKFKEGFDILPKWEFYERMKGLFCIVQTSEPSVYANIILKKGVVRDKQ